MIKILTASEMQTTKLINKTSIPNNTRVNNIKRQKEEFKLWKELITKDFKQIFKANPSLNLSTTNIDALIYLMIKALPNEILYHSNKGKLHLLKQITDIKNAFLVESNPKNTKPLTLDKEGNRIKLPNGKFLRHIQLVEHSREIKTGFNVLTYLSRKLGYDYHIKFTAIDFVTVLECLTIKYLEMVQIAKIKK